MLRTSSISPWLTLLVLVGGFALRAQQQQSARSPQRALINQYCAGCHNDKLKTGGLSLDAVKVENVGQAPEVWEKVLHKVQARYMPPVGMPRPDEKAYQSLVSY